MSQPTYRSGTNAGPGKVNLHGTVPFPLCPVGTSLRDCPLPAATQGKSQFQNHGPQREETCLTIPGWKELVNRKGVEGSGRGKRTLYKIRVPALQSRDKWTILKAGKDLVKMVRVLPVRPAGGSGSSGCKRSCGTGGRAAEEESPGWH